MAQLHSQRVKDATLITSVALAQAGANTPSIDLGQVAGGLVEGVQLEVSIPVVAGITDAKVLTFTLQDSADNSTFAALDPAVTTTVVAAGGAGTPAKTVDIRLPANTRRYVRIAQTATATSGTFSGSVTTALLL
jgi:hypothetical protein